MKGNLELQKLLSLPLEPWRAFSFARLYELVLDMDIKIWNPGGRYWFYISIVGKGKFLSSFIVLLQFSKDQSWFLSILFLNFIMLSPFSSP